MVSAFSDAATRHIEEIFVWEVKSVRKANLEKLAERILESAGCNSAQTLRIDVVALARHFHFSIKEVWDLPADVDGYVALTAEGRKEIGVNMAQSVESKRYTIVHELAYFLLHYKTGKLSFRHQKTSSGWRSRARGVEYLARCILMPRKTFRLMYRKFRQRETYHNVIFDLADMFRLPIEIVEERVRDLS